MIFFPQIPGRVELKGGEIDNCLCSAATDFKFEILLFKTKLRFRHPKPNAKGYKEFSGDPVDYRPFVNTESKARFHEPYDTAAWTALDFYSTAWKFPKRIWPLPSPLRLVLSVGVVSVVPWELEQYQDLSDENTAVTWLARGLKQQFLDINQVSFVPGPSGFQQMKFRSKDELVALEKILDLQVKNNTINGHRAFSMRPLTTEFDVFLPFSKEDMVRFCFQVNVDKNIDEYSLKALIEKAEQTAAAIVSSIELEYPSDRLS